MSVSWKLSTVVLQRIFVVFLLETICYTDTAGVAGTGGLIHFVVTCITVMYIRVMSDLLSCNGSTTFISTVKLRKWGWQCQNYKDNGDKIHPNI